MHKMTRVLQKQKIGSQYEFQQSRTISLSYTNQIFWSH